ncbi:MAG: hypothetical protein Q4C49_01095 [Bacillota bacterium]|nr:hypothetical protein [Bacillota bacterium]
MNNIKKVPIITALVKGVSESVENKWKERKIRKAIDNARDDAREKLEIAQDKLQMFLHQNAALKVREKAIRVMERGQRIAVEIENMLK